MTTVFIAGSIAIKRLHPLFEERLSNVVVSKLRVVLGDADGADKAIQLALFRMNSEQVVIYCSGTKPRNNLGNWPIKNVVSRGRPGTRSFFIAKDVEMAKVADYGLMIWDGRSTGTLSNVIELMKRRKKCVVFLASKESFLTVSDAQSFSELISNMSNMDLEKADDKIGLKFALQELAQIEIETHSPMNKKVHEMITEADFETYQAKNIEIVRALVSETGARPVLFLGSGISRRYLGAPNWLELLKAVATNAGATETQFNFLSQKAGSDPAKLGTLLVDVVHEWAWGTGRNNFPDTYFAADVDKSIFLKSLCAQHLKCFQELSKDDRLVEELDLLRKSAPHAIITTNFDTLIEGIFPHFELVVGEKIIPMSTTIIGELYKIHGSVEEPESLVLTDADYERFLKKRRYISSKMMTYFAEYPVFILGYGLGDANVNSIISDLGEALREKGGLLDNVIYVEWVPHILGLPRLKEEHVVPVASGSSPALRVRTIVTNDFRWLLNILAECASPAPYNVKVLRHLAAKVIDLVRSDIPKHNVEIDYKKIETLTDDKRELAMVLGISNVSNPNLEFPYIITQVAQKLGYTYWTAAKILLKEASKAKGYDIQASDNEYHFAFKSGTKQITHKYSESLVVLLSEIKSGMGSNSELDI
jgi:hypothetical protein